MPSITLDELTEIARQIEGTPSDKFGDISKAEFGWLYTPGKPLRQLKKGTLNIDSPASQVMNFMMGGGGALFQEAYTGTDAIAHLHNHPSGYMVPSLSDINSFLKTLADNLRLSFELIASTVNGKVNGFYQLEYLGKREDARSLVAGNDERMRRACSERQRFSEKNPGLFTPGRDIFTLGEYVRFSLEAMGSSNIVGAPRPLTGHEFKDWKFYKK